jgi:hypothetical protein
VHEALAVPGRLRRASLWPLLLPHAAGLALLVSLALMILIRPDLLAGTVDRLCTVLARGEPGPGLSRLLDTACVTALTLFFLFQGAGGFPLVRRSRRRR